MPSFLRLPPALLFLIVFVPAVSTSAADLEIVRVFAGWRSTDSFLRLSQYFGASENMRNARVQRSQPAEHAGYYWLVRVKNHNAAVAGAKFELKVISPASAEEQTFVFAANIPSGSFVYELGLTGSDWPGAKARPDAWHLSLLAADGTTLLARESFLWELPVKK
jgi:hypothetical protein